MIKHLLQFLLIIMGIILVALSLVNTPVTTAKEAPKTIQETVIVYKSDGFYENMTSYLAQKLQIAYQDNSRLQSSLESLEGSLQTMQGKLVFEGIAQKVSSSHSYDKFLFNCQHFSNELVQKLKEAGFQARVSTGYVKDDYCTYDNFVNFNCLHNWVTVSIPIEATTGRIISNEEFSRYYGEMG